MEPRDFFTMTREKLIRNGGRADQEDLERRYEAYKQQFTITHNEKIFKTYAAAEWFRRKYRPGTRDAALAQRLARKQESRNYFSRQLAQGLFDKLDFDEHSDQHSHMEQTEHSHSEQHNPDQTQDESSVKYDFDTTDNLNSLFIKSVSIDVKREELLEVTFDL